MIPDIIFYCTLKIDNIYKAKRLQIFGHLTIVGSEMKNEFMIFSEVKRTQKTKIRFISVCWFNFLHWKQLKFWLAKFKIN